MKTWRYRIKSPTMAILPAQGKLVNVTVPVDVVIDVARFPQADDRLVPVFWNNTEYLMFAQDLRKRSERLD